MLITITDLTRADGKLLRQWPKSGFALRLGDRMIVSMSSDGACQALSMHNTPGGPAHPVAREPTLDELRAWFKWQEKHGRTNQRFVEAGLPYPADD